MLTASKAQMLASLHARDAAIRLQGVTVRYEIPQEPIRSLKEYVIRRAKQQIRHRDFWALRDINIEVKQGEALGIIGRNGAGKSTLLKVISRVMRPTRGSVWVRGRIAPLLELGAGFHPELTGRENVFLNGTLLGHSQREIVERFDAMVEFAGIWEFIDAPLRTYSTGMATRLGFAVATAWQPDILILDEVLSVGDAEFQAKSAERIQELRANGATIFFVSHSIEAVQAVCDRAIWLDHGELIADGTVESVAQQYRGDARAAEAKRLAEAAQAPAPNERAEPGGPSAAATRWGSGRVEIVRVRICGATGAEQAIFQTGETMLVHLDYAARLPVALPTFGIAIHRQDGVHITGPNTGFAGMHISQVAGRGTVTFKIPFLTLLDGLYKISVASVNEQDTEIYDYHDRVYTFRVSNDNPTIGERYGLMTLRGEWEHIPGSE